MLRHVVHHRHEGVQVVRRPPGHAHAELHQNRVLDEAVLGEVLGQPQMPGVESLDLDLDAALRHHPGHLLQHGGGVGHYVVGLREIHRAAIERADFRAAVEHMLHPLRGGDEVGAFGVQRQRGGRRACHDVAAHPRRQVDDGVSLAVADPFHHLAVELRVARRGAGLGIAHMAVHHGGASARGGDGAVGDLLWRAGDMARAVLRAARAGDGAGDEDFAVHFERHDSLRFARENDGVSRLLMRTSNRDK